MRTGAPGGRARYIRGVGTGAGGWETWSWDECLFAGSAAYYEAGRLPYAPGLADAFARSLGLDGRGRLLDVGCGPGTVTLRLAPSFEAVVGLDPDAEMLSRASLAALRRGVGNATWVHSRAEDLPAGLGRFRAVIFAARRFALMSAIPMTSAAAPWPPALAGTPAVAVIEKAIGRGRLSHALLLAGDDPEGLSAAALAIADRILNREATGAPPYPVDRHPDCFQVRPAGKARMITAAAVRDLVARINVARRDSSEVWTCETSSALISRC